MSLHLTRLLLALLVSAPLLLVAGRADALLVPLRGDDRGWFPAAVEGVHIGAMQLRVERMRESEDLGGEGMYWRVEAELLVRNRQNREREVSFAVINPTGDPARMRYTTLHVDGAPVRGQVEALRHDPALRDHLYPSALRVSHAFGAREMIRVGIRTQVRATRDEVGQTFLELPLHALGLFDDSIETAWVEVRFHERVLGFRASLSDEVRYDDPDNRASWFAKDWNPSQPFRISWISAWPALVAVTRVESCPEPWTVARRMAGGNLSPVRTYLEAFDVETLEFCAILPLVVRGYVFESNRLREQLHAIDLSRYLPENGGRGPLYVENPLFQREDLGEVERLYKSTLQQFADPRTRPQAPAPEPEGATPSP